MSPTQIIATYEHIAVITGRMKSAAQNSEWDRLSLLERDCSKLVNTLRANLAPEQLDPQQQKRKYELLRQLLADDAEIRRHTEPWMEKLKALMESAGKTRRIHQAYGMGNGSFAGGHATKDNFGGA